MNTKDSLIHAVTAFDRKQFGKRGYNPYALPQYLARIDEVCADIERGTPARRAIILGFIGRLQDHCLRAIGQPIATKDEQNNSWCY